MNDDERYVILRLIDRAYPHVSSLLGGIFNQDWMLDFADWESAIDEYYCQACDSIKSDMVIEELEDLIIFMSEEQLKIVFRLIYTDIEPEVEGYTHMDWLKAVQTRIKLANNKNENK